MPQYNWRLLVGLSMPVGPLETYGPCTVLIVTHLCGLNIIKEHRLPSSACWSLSCSVKWSYSSEVWIILQADKSYTLTSNMLQKSCIMNGGEKKDGFGSDLSPSTYTLVVRVYQCQWAAEGFCMLLMSRLQETVPLCFSQFLAILVTFFLSNSHYNSSNAISVSLIWFSSLSVCLFISLAGRLTPHLSNAVCSHSFNSLLQQSCNVKQFFVVFFLSDCQTVTHHDPTKEKSAICT